MSYRRKLTLLLVFLSAAVTATTTSFMYFQFRHLLLESEQSKALSIAATAGALLNGDTHEGITDRSAEASQDYKTLADQLRRARNANQRADVRVKNIYTLKDSRVGTNNIEFVLDAEEDPANFSHVGDIYKGENNDPLVVGEYHADAHFSRDQWGLWLSANAPIRNSSGKAVAAVGIDLAADDVTTKLNRVLAIGVSAFGLGLLMALVVATGLSKRFTAPLFALRDTVVKVAAGDLRARAAVSSGDEFQELATSMNSMLEGLEERQTLKLAFARYVSQQVMERILSAGGSPAVTGDRKRVTVLFADIRGFTAMAESMAPEQVVRFLNRYFETMIEVIFKYHGTLDKFMGDGIMAVFGAPIDDPYQEENAVRAAVEMQVELKRLEAILLAEHGSTFRIGIGINSGSAVVGNIGSASRMEYTAIGDTVNLASRLEGATKELDADILISEHTYDSVRHVVLAEDRGLLQVRGRTHPISVYSVAGFKEKIGMVNYTL